MQNWPRGNGESVRSAGWRRPFQLHGRRAQLIERRIHCLDVHTARRVLDAERVVGESPGLETRGAIRASHMDRQPGGRLAEQVVRFDPDGWLIAHRKTRFGWCG